MPGGCSLYDTELERVNNCVILKKLGGTCLPSHPSTFWFKEHRLLLTVYVDDLMLSGPEKHHEGFWKELVIEVNIEEPEALDRFLGR